jgi:hypothetical protein
MLSGSAAHGQGQCNSLRQRLLQRLRIQDFVLTLRAWQLGFGSPPAVRCIAVPGPADASRAVPTAPSELAREFVWSGMAAGHRQIACRQPPT